MSSYNWGWWFVLTTIFLTSGMLVAMVATTITEIWYANGILIIGMVSLIPCLYVGMKPTKED
jgi:hypothetical protein